jgi:hypothetical protein
MVVAYSVAECRLATNVPLFIALSLLRFYLTECHDFPFRRRIEEGRMKWFSNKSAGGNNAKVDRNYISMKM